jgi:predicted transcriptional regulator YheO
MSQFMERAKTRVVGNGTRQRGRGGRQGSGDGSSAELKLQLLADLVPHLARAIAPNCEVVLHENTSDPPTIRTIANGHVTGRKKGDLMTRIVVDGTNVLDRKTPLFNYHSKTPAGKRVRVSLIPILEQEQVIGYLAINFMVGDLAIAQQAISILIRAEKHDEAIHEQFLSPHDIIEKTIEDFLHKAGRPAALLNKTERLELMRLLRDRGALRMRGAVEEVAARMGVSRAAVYNYISLIGGQMAPRRKRGSAKGSYVTEKHESRRLRRHPG